PRDVAVNTNPASPFFGRVYVANAQTNASNKGDGIFVFKADLSATCGQANAPRTAAYTNFFSSLSSADDMVTPYRLTVGPDDRVYICDYSTNSGNLIVADPDITSNQFVLKPMSGPAILPVNPTNTHGSIGGVVTAGSLS